MSRRSTHLDSRGRILCLPSIGLAKILALLLAVAACVQAANAQASDCRPVAYAGGLWTILEIVKADHGSWALLATEPTAHHPVVSRRKDPEHVAWIAKRQHRPDEVYIARMERGHRIGQSRRQLSLASSSSSASGPLEVRIQEIVWSPRGSRLLISSSHRGKNTVRILDVTADVRQPAKVERLEEGETRSDFVFIDERRLAYKRRTDAKGEVLVIRQLSQDRVLVAEDIHDLIYSEVSKALFYRRYDGRRDVGLYRWSLDHSGEVALLNARGSSQAFPRVSEDPAFAGLLAFASNYGGRVQELEDRTPRNWRIYVESIERLRQIESAGAYDQLEPKTSYLLEDHQYQYQFPDLKKRNVLIWHGSSIYFQPQGSDAQIIELHPTKSEQNVWCVPSDLSISIRVAASQQQPAQLRRPMIGGFDVFTSSGETFVVASTRMTEENAGNLTTLFVFRLGR